MSGGDWDRVRARAKELVAEVMEEMTESGQSVETSIFTVLAARLVNLEDRLDREYDDIWEVLRAMGDDLEEVTE